MSWEITWKAANFAPHYTYDEEEYCTMSCATMTHIAVTGSDYKILLIIIIVLSVELQSYSLF